VYVNELTGQPLSWTVVEQLRTPSGIPDNAPAAARKISADMLQKLLTREVEKLKDLYEVCTVCRKKTKQFKTLRDYQTIYFCSLNCLEKWEG
jgi:hypothetical protein